MNKPLTHCQLVNNDNKFIINADDFGKNIELNSAIIKCFSLQLISSTSLLTNMDGFQNAVEAAHSNSYIKNNIGVHINLTEGLPLTDDIKNCKRFCNSDGYFIYNRKQSIFFLSKVEQSAVYTEIKAQIEKVIKSGIIPSHIDSHHHIHTEWGITQILIIVLKQYKITKIRCSRNLGTDNIQLKKIYKKGFNYYLKNVAGYTCTHYFGSINDLAQSNFPVGVKGKLIEIMVHPMYNKSEDLVDDDQYDLLHKLSPLINKSKVISPNEY